MAVTLASLPPEVLYYHLINFLDANDVLNLCLCGVLLPSQELYDSVFHDHTMFDNYDIKLFQSRANCSLYMLGNADEGRFGVPDTRGPEFEHVYSPLVFDGPFPRTHTPIKLASNNSPICQVASGQSVQMLGTNGDLYYTGTWKKSRTYWPTYLFQFLKHTFSGGVVDAVEDAGESQSTELVRRVTARRNLPDVKGVTDNLIVDDSACHTQIERIFSSTIAPTRFTEVASLESFFYAIDESGLIWEWTRHRHPTQGVPVLLTETVPTADAGAVSHVLRPEASMIRVSSSFKACYVPGKGIVSWFQRAAARSWRNGYPCDGDRLCLAHVNTVPGTVSGVMDYILVGNWCVYLTTDRRVTAVNLFELEKKSNVEIWHYRRDGLAGQVVFPMEEFNVLGRFTQISGNGKNTFCLLSDECALIVRYTEIGKRFVLVQKVVNLDFAAVSVGFRHFLALTKQGEVYSWGQEDKCNGCLGLGNMNAALEMSGVREEGDNLVVDEPIKIPLSRKVYAIMAGRDCSGLLM